MYLWEGSPTLLEHCGIEFVTLLCESSKLNRKSQSTALLPTVFERKAWSFSLSHWTATSATSNFFFGCFANTCQPVWVGSNLSFSFLKSLHILHNLSRLSPLLRVHLPNKYVIFEEFGHPMTFVESITEFSMFRFMKSVAPLFRVKQHSQTLCRRL